MTQAALETVRVIFDSQGHTFDEASYAQMIIGSAKSTIFHVLGNAQQICHVCKRQRLTVNDINDSLESLDMEPLLGYNSTFPPDLIEATDSSPHKLLAYNDSYIPPEGKIEMLPIPLATHSDIQWITVNGNVHENTESADILSDKPDPNQPKLTGPQRQTIQDSDAFIFSNKHQFSFTHQKYFRESRAAILSPNLKQRETMFYALSTSDCIQMLVPYYIRFSLVQFRDHPNDFNTLSAALGTARSLIQNSTLHYIECYLQNFITIALSFLLSETMLKKNPLEFVRMIDMTSEFLLVICDKMQAKYPKVQPHLTDQLLSVLLNKDTSVNQKFGSFVALSSFGPQAVSSYILPVVNDIVNDLLEGPMRSGDRDTRLIAQTMYDRIISSVGICLHSDTSKSSTLGFPVLSPKTYKDHEKILNLFGSLLLPYYIDDSVDLFI